MAGLVAGDDTRLAGLRRWGQLVDGATIGLRTETGVVEFSFIRLLLPEAEDVDDSKDEEADAEDEDDDEKHGVDDEKGGQTAEDRRQSR